MYNIFNYGWFEWYLNIIVLHDKDIKMSKSVMAISMEPV